MNPDVVAAVERLVQDGVLAPAQAVPLARVARGELVSVRPELRLLLYGGVIAVMGGIGRLVQENLDRIGPVAIAVGLWIAALSALAWAQRHAPPFSWGESTSTDLAYDYVLLLGVLLTGAALAYVEVKFTPLGAAWSYHLLAMSLFAAAVAVRGDSRVVASIALSTFAAWRGVSASPLEHGFWLDGQSAEPLRINALITGVLFVALGAVLVRTGKKAHFEPLATHLGWLLVLVALFPGINQFGLLLVGAGLAAWSFLRGRFPLFGMGFVAAYIALSGLVVTGVHDELFALLWFSVTGVVALASLLFAQKKMRDRA